MRTSSPKSSQCPVLLVADFDVHCIACYMMLFGTGFEGGASRGYDRKWRRMLPRERSEVEDRCVLTMQHGSVNDKGLQWLDGCENRSNILTNRNQGARAENATYGGAQKDIRAEAHGGWSQDAILLNVCSSLAKVRSCNRWHLFGPVRRLRGFLIIASSAAICISAPHPVHRRAKN